MASSTSMTRQEEEPSPPIEAGGGGGRNGRRRRRRNRNRNRQREKAKFKGENYRNWADDLPWPALSLILRKLGGVEVLMNAQWVCRAWWKVSLDPCLWRITDMMNHPDISSALDMEAMAMVAIDRSKGYLQEFYAECFGSDGLLRNIADRTSNLKCLRLISAYGISDEGLAVTISRFLLLEELDLTHCYFTKQVCKLVGQACPQLKCFRFNTLNSKRLFEYDFDLEDDDEFNMPGQEAFDIANTMPGLHRLQLVGSSLNNEGLNAVLDKCVHLESLDIRRCFHVNLDASLKAKCARIKELRLPDDSTEDYGWVFEDDDGSYSEYGSYSPDHLFYDYYDEHGLVFDDDYELSDEYFESSWNDPLGLFFDDYY